MVIDSSDNIYITDYGIYNGSNGGRGSVIRKIKSDGTVTTIAGDPNSAEGNIDGKGAAAKFASPYSLAIDPLGNIYAIDPKNHNIRKITPEGDVSTLAGAWPTNSIGRVSAHDGPAMEAIFPDLHSIAVDKQNTIYVHDGKLIRKIGPDKMVSTISFADPISDPCLDYNYKASAADSQRLYFDGKGKLYHTCEPNSGEFVLGEIKIEGGAATFTRIKQDTDAKCSALRQLKNSDIDKKFETTNGIASNASGNIFISRYCGKYAIYRISADGTSTEIVVNSDSK